MNLLWEVQLSKFTKILYSGFVVGARGFFWVFEFSQMKSLAIYNYLCTVFSSLLAPAHPLIAGTIITLPSTILPILSFSGIPKIVILIVQAVAVFVVYLHTQWRRHNFIMHKNRFSFSSKRTGCKSKSVSIVVIHPMPLIQTIKAMIGNQCNLSVIEFNFFHAYLQTKVLVVSWDKHDTTSRNILAHFHLLIPSEIINLNYTIGVA